MVSVLVLDQSSSGKIRKADHSDVNKYYKVCGIRNIAELGTKNKSKKTARGQTGNPQSIMYIAHKISSEQNKKSSSQMCRVP
jgi:hypothetical protein